MNGAGIAVVEIMGIDVTFAKSVTFEGEMVEDVTFASASSEKFVGDTAE